jgi:hypothetical protein
MEPKDFQRSFAAFLCADAVCCSRVMQDDQSPTVQPLEACRWIFSDHVMQHRSRVVDSPGGNPLVECAGVADAPNSPPKTGLEPVMAVRHHLVPDPGRV